MSKVVKAAPAATVVSAAERHRMIAEAAYYRALNRQFHGGDAVQDWLDAERQINALLPATAAVAGWRPQGRANERRRRAPPVVR